METSEFDGWFVEQFGERSASARTDFDLTIEVGRMRAALMDFEIELEDRRRWDTRHAAALKAWRAQESKT